ncbi:hypothetical protein [Streptomyces sp. CA-111067]|uniref:hypothetical protein n=1 Tax=Streptomyces sp. CA-111067 TaxID=3240046 RepID=UPI003D952865
MITDLIAYGFVTVALALLVVGIRRHRPRGADRPAGPVLVPDPYLRLPCHGLACGHMTTRHLPNADQPGTAICRECGAIRTDHA